jgi:hypothetical protein
MKLTELTAIGLRIFAVYLFMYALNQSALLIGFIDSDNYDGANRVTPAFYIFWVGTPLLISIVIWFFPITTTKLFLPKYKTDTFSPVEKSELYIAAIVLVGIFILSTAIPDVLYWVIRVYLAADLMDSGLDFIFTPKDKASMVATVIQLIMGIWLLFGAKGLLGFVIRARSWPNN